MLLKTEALAQLLLLCSRFDCSGRLSVSSSSSLFCTGFINSESIVAMTITALQTVSICKNWVALATVGQTRPMKTTRVGRPRALEHRRLVSMCKRVTLVTV